MFGLRKCSGQRVLLNVPGRPQSDKDEDDTDKQLLIPYSTFCI